MVSTPAAKTIFISSTLEDLGAYREAVRTAIYRMGHHVDDTIHWSAEPDTPLNVSLARVRASDLLIVLVAHRYGTIPQGEERSVTEAEFDTAVDAGIPVIAFVLDRQFSWNPSLIEYDPVRRAKLAAFLEKVERRTLRRPFTSIDSLEAAVTQSIVAWGAGRRGGSGSHEDDEGVSAPRVLPRDVLAYEPDGMVALGGAPDGLPLVLAIERAERLDRRLKRLAELARLAPDDPLVQRVKADLLGAGRRNWSELGRCSITPAGAASGAYYVTRAPLSSLVSGNLLHKLLPANDALVPEFGTMHSRLFDRTETTALEAQQGRDARVESTGGENRFLAVPLDTGALLTVSKDDPRSPSWRVASARDFVREGFAQLRGWTAKVTVRLSTGRERMYQPEQEAGEYDEVLTDLLRRGTASSANAAITYDIPVASLLHALAALADGLHEHHRVAPCTQTSSRRRPRRRTRPCFRSTGSGCGPANVAPSSARVGRPRALSPFGRGSRDRRVRARADACRLVGATITPRHEYRLPERPASAGDHRTGAYIEPEPDVTARADAPRVGFVPVPMPGV
jgi:hypothetical protein